MQAPVEETPTEEGTQILQQKTILDAYADASPTPPVWEAVAEESQENQEELEATHSLQEEGDILDEQRDEEPTLASTNEGEDKEFFRAEADELAAEETAFNELDRNFDEDEKEDLIKDIELEVESEPELKNGYDHSQKALIPYKGA